MIEDDYVAALESAIAFHEVQARRSQPQQVHDWRAYPGIISQAEHRAEADRLRTEVGSIRAMLT